MEDRLVIGGKEYLDVGWKEGCGYGPQKRRKKPARVWGYEVGSDGGNYSTVKSAQRLSATLSIRPRGRVQIIDM